MTDRITAPPKGAPTVDRTGTLPKQQSQARRIRRRCPEAAELHIHQRKKKPGRWGFPLIYDGNLTVADGEVFEALKDCVTRELKSKGIATEQASKKRPGSGGYGRLGTTRIRWTETGSKNSPTDFVIRCRCWA